MKAKADREKHEKPPASNPAADEAQAKERAMIKKIKEDAAKEEEEKAAKEQAKADAKAALPKNPAVEAADIAAASASVHINAAVAVEKERINADLDAAAAKKEAIEKKIKNPPPPSAVSGEVWTANMPEKYLKWVWFDWVSSMFIYYLRTF